MSLGLNILSQGKPWLLCFLQLQMEMEVILRYSPFKTEEDFFAQFDRIEGDSGTLVIVYNMKLLENGDPELDILNDPQDIILTNPESDFDSDDG